MVVTGENEVLIGLWVSIPQLNLSAGNTVCQLLLCLILFYFQCSVASVTNFFLL